MSAPLNEPSNLMEVSNYFNRHRVLFTYIPTSFGFSSIFRGELLMWFPNGALQTRLRQVLLGQY